MTIADAAETAGVSYATVYRQLKRGIARSRQAENGAIFVLESDLPKLEPVERERSEHPSVTVRIPPERLARWQAAAGDGRSVSKWLGDLADAASHGFSPKKRRRK